MGLIHNLFITSILIGLIGCELYSKGNKKDYPDERQKYTQNHRRGRFLSLFTYIQFANEECTGGGSNGTCMTATECARKGGNAKGPCAGGYGVCCMVMTTCGSILRENGTYFVHPNYPNNYDGIGSCQITLMKPNTNICQYRLDFNEFILADPEPVHNVCTNDQFIVSGGSQTPTICGYNSGNHIYIDAGSSNPIVLSVVTSGPSFARTWKIKIIHIQCNSPYKAEEGCLQYFTGVAGQIQSFNYEPTSGLQLSNQDYTICIRTERNFCSIQYTQCPHSVNNRSQSFTLSGNSNNSVQAMVGSTGNANFCQSDYIIIPMASNVGRPVTSLSVNVDRICGGVLSADVTLQLTTVRSTVRPFRIVYHTDGIEAPNDRNNKGFCLNYVQQPCSTNF